MVTRRSVLQGAGGLLTLGMLSKLAQARTAPRAKVADNVQFFLFVQVYGAWDVCLAFDPKDRTAKLPDGSTAFDQPYSIEDIKDFGNGIHLPPDGQVLGKYADRLMIVNGIDMEVDNGHVVDNMMGGVQQPRASNLPWIQCLIAKHHSYLKTCSVPHLYTSYDGQFFAGPYQSTSVTATGTDFLAFLGSAMSTGGGGLSGIHGMVDEYAAAQATLDRRRAISGYSDAIGRALAVGSKLQAVGFQPPADVTTPQNMGTMLGELFASGVLGSASLSFGQNYFFDTHSNHYATHPLGKALTDLNTTLASLAQIPLDANTSVFDRTTVVMAAEFCRTPLLNPQAGKDHNIQTNSFVVLGHKARPGVYGASGYVPSPGNILAAHTALPVDFATGQVATNGQVMHARNLWAGFGGVCGVDLSGSFGDVQPVGFFG